MTYRPDDQGDVSIGQAEIDIQEMLQRELYGLLYQKVVFASVIDVQEARKACMLALIDGLDPRLNIQLIHLQALDMDHPVSMPAVSGQSDVSATEYFRPRFIVFPMALVVDLAGRILCSIRSFP